VASLSKNIPGASRNLAADHDAAMPIPHPAVANDDVLDWRVQTPAVVVPA
jgi:hypothetical protein